MRRQYRKRSGNGFVSILIFLFTIATIFLLRTHGSSLAAQTADGFLRPVLGDKNTIALESTYFGIGDQLKQVQYKIEKPNPDIFTSNTPSTPSQANTGSINLVNIHFQNNFSPLPLEGVWQPIQQALFPGQIVMAKTFLRPDPNRDYAIVSLVKIDMQKLAVGIQAGTYYPGGTHGVYGPGIVPKIIQHSNNLISVFNGGFQEADGHYGMIVGNKTYVPLHWNLASLIISSSGTAKIINYQGQSLGKNIVGIRQNGAFLIKKGVITPFVENNTDTWGRTTTNSMYTWRSGIGITKNGNIIYAVGNSLLPQTLAVALQQAGAVNAMQLDINPYWVRFILYNSSGNGTYSYQPLLKDMYNGGYAYLHGYNKDFFYIYKRF